MRRLSRPLLRRRHHTSPSKARKNDHHATERNRPRKTGRNTMLKRFWNLRLESGRLSLLRRGLVVVVVEMVERVLWFTQGGAVADFACALLDGFAYAPLWVHLCVCVCVCVCTLMASCAGVIVVRRDIFYNRYILVQYITSISAYNHHFKRYIIRRLRVEHRTTARIFMCIRTVKCLH